MSENISQTPEFTPLQMELIDAARNFVRQPGSVLIQYPAGSPWQHAITYLRAARTPEGEELIVRINEGLRPDLPYDVEQRSWDEHIHVSSLNAATSEYTSIYAVERTNGSAEWHPDHTDKANSQISQEQWRKTGGQNTGFLYHDMEVTDSQLEALVGVVNSPEIQTDPEATKVARDYYLQVYGQPPEQADESDRLSGRSPLVRFIAKCLDL